MSLNQQLAKLRKELRRLHSEYDSLMEDFAATCTAAEAAFRLLAEYQRLYGPLPQKEDHHD